MTQPLNKISKNNIGIEDILRDGFHSWKRYVFRVDYSIQDYRRRTIPWNYSTFKMAIRIILNAWIATISLTILGIRFDNPFIINISAIEKMLNAERLDLIALQYAIVFALLEWQWIRLFYGMFKYCSSWNEFFDENLPYVDNQLRNDCRRYLIDFYAVSNTFSRTTFKILKLIILLTNLVFVFGTLILYRDGHIDLIQSFGSIFLMAFVVLTIWEMFGQIFIAMNFLLFLVEYIKIKLQQLSCLKQTVNGLQKNNPTVHIMIEWRKKLIWNRFQSRYVRYYAETIQLNGTVRIVLFYMEIISKISIMISCIFYSRQKHLSWSNTALILSLISEFFFVTGVYSRMANIYTYNQLIAKSMMQMIARSQWLRNKHRNRNNRSIHYWPYSIKSNLFVQTMTNNGFGFTCGRIFQITKYRYIELICWNIPIIIIFYKKICYP